MASLLFFLLLKLCGLLSLFFLTLNAGKFTMGAV
jgi:hypothetical protein